MDSPTRVEDLFLAALACPADARPAFLDAACAGDAELRREVERLLAAHPAAAGFLETLDTPTSAHEAHPTDAHVPERDATGEVVAGRYKLLDRVGEGGMGSVWRAQQSEPVKRLVAVKLIKAGMDSRAVVARFEAERQALAVMDHPNIARILDGGLHANRPFFVMELVKGVPITEFCDARKLTPRERLELFVPVCQAIQHAHQKGVIHRDIKPSNVLVALYDDRPVPKVIDFGVAKATGAALTDGSYLTAFGGVVGTPQYMSPEQASLNNLDIDTRSDVYSLGVLLYELLAGSPPFARAELEMAGLLEVLRVVREEEPPRPSAKLSTASAKASLCASRGTEPGKLAGLLKGELDWVVMHALEKSRERRYESAASFAADVGRYLAGEQVLAVPPSVGYRVRKWARKNRGLVVTASVVAAALLIGLAGTTWGLVVAERERARAVAEEAKVRDEQTKAQAARDAAELTLVRSFLRPIGYNPKEIDQAELVAFDELSRQPDDRMKLLFLREACRDGETALRVARRAERVIQAAVGPSLTRRAEVLAWAGEVQRDPAADPRSRLCACWFAIELGSEDLPALGEAFEVLAARKVEGWKDYVGRLAKVVHPDRESDLINAIVKVIDITSDGAVIAAVCEVLTNLSTHPSAAQASQNFDNLIKLFKNNPEDYIVRDSSLKGLASLASHLDAIQAAHDFGVFVTLMNEPESSPFDFREDLELVLANLTLRLDAVKAAQEFDSLVAQLDKSPKLDVRVRTGKCLAVLAPRLDEAQAARRYDTLIELLGKTMDEDVIRAACQGLGGLEPPQDIKKSTQSFDVMLALLDKTKNGEALDAVCISLKNLAPRIDANRASKGFDVLLTLLGKTTDPGVDFSLCVLLEALSSRLDAKEVSGKFDAFIMLQRDAPRIRDRWLASMVSDKLISQLTSPEVNGKFDTLLALFDKAESNNARYAIVPVLRSLAYELKGVKAMQAFKIFVRVAVESQDSDALSEAGYGLYASARHMEGTHAVQSFDALIAVLGTTTNEDALTAVCYGLDDLAARVPIQLRARAVEVSMRRMKTAPGTRLWRASVHGVTKLVRDLDPPGRAKKSVEVARQLLASTRIATDREIDSEALASLLQHIDSTPTLVDFLREPQCVGRVKNAILLRLEQLADPPSFAQAAFLAGLADAIATTSDARRRRDRRFRTTSDAAAWVAQHHPEIDLDRPYSLPAK